MYVIYMLKKLVDNTVHPLNFDSSNDAYEIFLQFLCLLFDNIVLFVFIFLPLLYYCFKSFIERWFPMLSCQRILSKPSEKILVKGKDAFCAGSNFKGAVIYKV